MYSVPHSPFPKGEIRTLQTRKFNFNLQKRGVQFSLGVVALTFIVTGFLVGKSGEGDSPAVVLEEQNKTTVGQIAAVTPAVSEAAHTLLAKEFLPATVAYVVDGDTVDVVLNGERIRVRLIGINTPETVDPRKPVECFGKEASDKAKEILKEGSAVYLEADASQTKYDRYGRFLAYIFLADGTSLNKLMISEGFAHEYTYRTPYKYQKEFRLAESKARSATRGLWNPAACPTT